MDIKNVLVSRGELIVVVLVALVCAFYVYSVYGDTASQPKADEQSIRSEFAAIKEASSRDAPRPEPRQPVDSLRAMRQRLGAQAPAPALSQWLGKHPNVIATESGRDKQFLYAYQILMPELKIKSHVGSFDITMETPADLESSDPRVGGGGDWKQERKVPGGDPVVNRARVVAIEIQERHGGADKPWQAVTELQPQGLLPIKAGDVLEKTVNQIQSGQDYQYRARLLVAATGFQDTSSVDQAVVVFRGRLLEQPDWSEFSDEKRSGHYTKLKTALEGPALASALPRPPTGVMLEGKERCFVGPWCPPVDAEAPTDFRLGLKSVSEFDGKVSARIYLRKLLRGVDNEAIGWTEAGKQFSVDKGEKLGEMIIVDDPASGRKIEVDLTTDLVLVGIEKDVERVIFYEVDDKTNEEGKKVLEVQPKIKRVDIAKLRDESTGKEIDLIQLQRITWRSGDIIYPKYPGESPYDERSGLEADDPSDYQSPRAPKSLKVAEPIWHKADDPLLWRFDKLAQTDQPYIEFPDGRLVYYDHINKKIFVVDMTPEETLIPNGDAADGDDLAPEDGVEDGAPPVE